MLNTSIDIYKCNCSEVLIGVTELGVMVYVGI